MGFAIAMSLAASACFITTACSSSSSTPPAPYPLPPPLPVLSDQALLDLTEQRTFAFFWDTADPTTGLIPDRYPAHSFASIAAVGFGLTAYPIGVERGYVSRADASARVLKTLRFLDQAPQNADPAGATGYNGFYYHFLDMTTGKRFQQTELSTIDTALFLAGALACQSYFTGSDAAETEIRQLVDHIYGRVNWTWIMPRANAISMGWTPESGFLPWDWQGYSEGMILLVLALGSPTHPISADAWAQYTSTQSWATFQGQDYVNFGPLFGHQFSHVWLDFHGIQDAYMTARGIDYAENTRRATLAQRAYAIQNPGQWTGYGSSMWGFSACDGPIAGSYNVGGRQRAFFSYMARGVSAGDIQDDGTITPSAAFGSLPFTPELSIPVMQAMYQRFGSLLYSQYGYFDAFNETFPTSVTPSQGRSVPGLGWVDTDYLGIDQGLILAMLENHRSGLIWNLMRTNPNIIRGLKAAGFHGGWIDTAVRAKAPTIAVHHRLSPVPSAFLGSGYPKEKEN